MDYEILDQGNERILILGEKQYRTFYSKRIIEAIIERKGADRAVQYFSHKKNRSEFLAPLFRSINDKFSNLKVLEVGCSVGHITEYLNEQPASWIISPWQPRRRV